jgi:hypothetical protein
MMFCWYLTGDSAIAVRWALDGVGGCMVLEIMVNDWEERKT